MGRSSVSCIALALAGCATVTGTSQYVAIDSDVAGVEVRSAAAPDRILGITPFFTELPRAQAHAFLVRHAGFETRLEVDCGYRWAESVGGNLVPTLAVVSLSLPWAAAALVTTNGIDYLSGAGWHCPEYLSVPSTPLARERPPGRTGEPETQEDCPVYAIAPPLVDDPRLADLIVLRISDRLAERSPCSRVADLALTERVLWRRGVSHFTGIDPEGVSRQLLSELGYRTGATRLVVPRFEALRAATVVHTDEVDLFTRERRPLITVLVEIPARLLSEASFLGLLSRSFALVPNAAFAGITLRQMPYRSTSGFDVRSVDLFPDSTPVAASIGFVEPRRGDGPWGWTLRLASTAQGGYDSRNVQLVDLATGAERDAAVRTLYGALGIGPLLALRVPTGVISVFVAGGLAASSSWEPWGDSRLGVDVAGIAGASYDHYLTERLVLRVGLTLLQTATPLVNRAEYRLSTVFAPILSLGFVVPETREWVRDALF